MGNSPSRDARRNSGNDFLHLSQIQVSALELSQREENLNNGSSLATPSNVSSSTETSSTGCSENSAGSSDFSSQSTDYSDDSTEVLHESGVEFRTPTQAHQDLSRALPAAIGRLSPAQRVAIMARRELPEEETTVDLIEEMEDARLNNNAHVTLIVAQAFLTLLFLGLLLRKLNRTGGEVSWIVVFAPLIGSNFVRVVARSVELWRLSGLVARFRNNASIPQHRFFCIAFPSPMLGLFTATVLDSVDSLGEMVTAIALALYLDSPGHQYFRNLLLVCVPLWLQVFWGTVFRCWSCSPDNSVDGFGDPPRSLCLKRLATSLKAIGYLTYKAAPAALIALRVEGIINIPWVGSSKIFRDRFFF